MKTVALLIPHHTDDEQRIRVVGRTISLLTTGGWHIVIPDSNQIHHLHIINTCVQMGRGFTVMGFAKRPAFTVPRGCYRRVAATTRNWQERQWELENRLIAEADLVECFGQEEIEDRIPIRKSSRWFSVLSSGLVRVPGGLDAEYPLVVKRGLGYALLKQIKAA